MSDPRQLKIMPETVEGYTLTQKLGQGSTGTVFKAKNIAKGDPFAIKLIFPHIASKPGFNDAFVRMARHAARIDHPSIVRTHSSGTSGGYHFVVMEYVEGKTLEAVLSRGAMDETRCLQITLAVAKALEHARSVGIVHRDVKPANILLPRGADAKLADLGLAVLATNPAVPGGVTGTPAYLPPEAARCEAGIDSRADVYSLGATLHHMLTGQPMFSGSVAEVVAAHLSEKPKPPARVNATVSTQASKLVEKMTEKKAADRPQPAEVAAFVEALLRGEKPFEVSIPRKGGAGTPEEKAAKDAPTSVMPPPLLAPRGDRATTPHEETIASPRSPAAQSPGAPPARQGYPSPYPPVPAYPPAFPPAAPAPPGRGSSGFPSPYPPAPPWQPGPPAYPAPPSPYPPAGAPPPYPPVGAPPPYPPVGAPPPPYPHAGVPAWPSPGSPQPPPTPAPPPGKGSKGGKMAKRRKPGRRWEDLI